MRIHQRFTAASGAVVLSVVLAACGGGQMEGMSGTGGETGSSNSSSAPAESSVDAAHNEADTAFSQGMIVHHRGALAMAELATSKAQSPGVQDLAGRIAAAQEPEIATMTSFLDTWGEDVPEGMQMGETGGMEGMDHGGTAMGGMDMEEAVAQLESASGAEFDRMFLEMMSEHHAEAVEMAQVEQADGENPQAVELAASIEADQAAEVEEMQQLLPTL
ncbi:MAG: hypothetical protein AVDCRST_MAG35-1155 [uncultured Quadrisphaera sp.]|uniref:DUF305 domain-containing protein n=1 Tax=uncultured Quadrisphaera sp. TaxID=904978 RepID=A0A6J4P4A3_9ACTN|nr:MAG: hypothetical protein AVDCRST_MAG35-1155 [uncultured Quadrisphaera sp.]